MANYPTTPSVGRRARASLLFDERLPPESAERQSRLCDGGRQRHRPALAERFAEHSAKVVLAGRKQQKLDAAASAIRAAGGAAETAALDVRDYTAVANAPRKTRERFGEIGILLCAAAGNFRAPVTGMSANGFKGQQRHENDRSWLATFWGGALLAFGIALMRWIFIRNA